MVSFPDFSYAFNSLVGSQFLCFLVVYYKPAATLNDHDRILVFCLLDRDLYASNLIFDIVNMAITGITPEFLSQLFCGSMIDSHIFRVVGKGCRIDYNTVDILCSLNRKILIPYIEPDLFRVPIKGIAISATAHTFCIQDVPGERWLHAHCRKEFFLFFARTLHIKVSCGGIGCPIRTGRREKRPT